MTLRAKLVTSFLACGPVPLGGVTHISRTAAAGGMNTLQEQGETDLSKKTYGQLTALRDVKKAQLETHFGERQGDMGVLSGFFSKLRRCPGRGTDPKNSKRLKATESKMGDFETLQPEIEDIVQTIKNTQISAIQSEGTA
ncbi:MAG: hypothetical protein GY842_17260 [bacterium]|nr:hypothetical protein [bacterium]